MRADDRQAAHDQILLTTAKMGQLESHEKFLDKYSATVGPRGGSPSPSPLMNFDFAAFGFLSLAFVKHDFGRVVFFKSLIPKHIAAAFGRFAMR